MKPVISWALAAVLALTPSSILAQVIPRTHLPPEALASAAAELKAERYSAAEAAYSRLLASHPRHPELLAGMAHAELGQNKLEAAFSRLQVLRTLYPDHAGVHFLLGTLFAKAGMVQPAARSLIRAVALNPASQPFRLALARSLVETGQLYVAASQYSRLLEQEEARQQRPDPAVIYELADLATRLEMTEDATRLYRLLLSLEPDTPRAAIARQRLGLSEQPPESPETNGAP